MRSSKAQVLAPLTGVVAVALFVASLAIQTDSPNTKDGGVKILADYAANRSDFRVSAALLLYGCLFLIFFTAALRSGLRRGEHGADGPATLAFGGGLVMATGLMLLGGTEIAISDNVKYLSPASAQTINALSDGIWVPFIAGQAALMFGAGFAILHGRALPAWLGWVALVLGVVSATPVGWFAFLLGMLWILVVSILLARRASQREAAPTAEALAVD